MFERFFSILDGEISNSIHGVVRSEEFRDLGQEVKKTFRDAVGDGDSRRQSRKSRHRPPRSPISPDPSVQVEVHPLRYLDSRFPWRQVSSILLLMFGRIFGVASASLLTALVVAAAALSAVDVLLTLVSITIPFNGLSARMITQGYRIRGRLSRIARYLNGVGVTNFCSVDQPARLARKSPTFVVGDLEKVIRSSMLPDGYLDDQETCLIPEEETYQQYLQAQQSVEKWGRRSAQRREPGESTAPFKGRDLLNQIGRAKNFITDRIVLLKMSHLESVTEKMLNYVEEHPEKGSQIRRFSEYYLPATLKLIHSCCRFDSQPVRGENITSVKKQTHESLGTINTAFENLLDGLFGGVTMDISSDISVLEVMLAREGLTGDDFRGSDDTR